ncbi:MAG: protein kinase [Gemmataceae bacterium]|nr:protein kinase [Gemmataceae bacterium]
MPAHLVALMGPDEGRNFPLTQEPLLLGRSRAAGGYLIDPHVAKVHCQISYEDGGWHVSDFESPSGTFVNGKRIDPVQKLNVGDLIRIGKTSLQFQEDADLAGEAAVGASPSADSVSDLPRHASWAEGLVGQKLGHYKVGTALARGRHGYVFHGKDTRRNLAVALKVLDPVFGTNDATVQSFVAAMKQVLPLRHPHLLKVYGAGKSGPHCWIAEEYVHGESLAAVIGRIESAGTVDWRHALRIGLFLAQALDYAHQKKLLHLNVTPHNILVGKTPRETKLTDLMLSEALEEDPTVPISAAGVPSENLGYQPPERTRRGPAVDARADVYSLGASLYGLMTGRPPFVGNTVEELVAKIRLEKPVVFSTLMLRAPRELEEIIFKCLAKSPDERFQTIREVVQALSTFIRE